MSELFNAFIYQPILWVLVFIYENLALRDFGASIIILTVFVRVILFPIFYKGAKNQTILQKLQPRVDEIRKKHKEDKEKQAKELMSLYKENKINPLSGFFLLILQLPIFFALFKIFTQEVNGIQFDNHLFLGLIDLGEKSIVLAAIAAFLQYVNGKISLPKKGKTSGAEGTAASVGRMMLFLAPILTLFILMKLPGALGMYWTASTVFSIGQQMFINKKINKTDGVKNQTNIKLPS